MRRVKIFIISLMLLLLACQEDSAPKSVKGAICVPAFQELSGEQIFVEVGSWRVRFRVALIGCKADLQLLTPEELKLLEREFRRPSEWSPHAIYANATGTLFRENVKERLNFLLGREVVADVVIYNVVKVEKFEDESSWAKITEALKRLFR